MTKLLKKLSGQLLTGMENPKTKAFTLLATEEKQGTAVRRHLQKEHSMELLLTCQTGLKSNKTTKMIHKLI